MPWAKDFLVYDIETTGTDPDKYGLCQLGAVKVCKACFRIYDEFISLARPTSRDVDPKAMSVHNIPMDVLLESPEPKGVLADFETWLSPKPKLFMPATWGQWDQWFLRGVCRRIGVRFFLTGKHIDVKSIAYHEIAKSKGQYPTGGLGKVSGTLGLPEFKQHDALQDAARTAEILREFSTIRRCEKHLR